MHVRCSDKSSGSQPQRSEQDRLSQASNGGLDASSKALCRLRGGLN